MCVAPASGVHVSIRVIVTTRCDDTIALVERTSPSAAVNSGRKRAEIRASTSRARKNTPAKIVRIHRAGWRFITRSEEHTSELQSRSDLVCRLLLEKKKCAH